MKVRVTHRVRTLLQDLVLLADAFDIETRELYAPPAGKTQYRISCDREETAAKILNVAHRIAGELKRRRQRKGLKEVRSGANV